MIGIREYRTRSSIRARGLHLAWPTIFTVASTIVFFTLERIAPGWPLPKVKGWYSRAVALNLVPMLAPPPPRERFPGWASGAIPDQRASAWAAIRENTGAATTPPTGSEAPSTPTKMT